MLKIAFHRCFYVFYRLFFIYCPTFKLEFQKFKLKSVPKSKSKQHELYYL